MTGPSQSSLIPAAALLRPESTKRRHELRASRLPLLARCSGSSWLPHSQSEDSEELKKAVDWGHLVHRWKETGRVFGSDRRTEAAFTRAIQRSAISRDSLWPDGGVHEHSVAIRVDGVRAVVVGRPPEAEITRWVTGSSDFYYFFADGCLWVDDLKTGKWYDDPNAPGTNRFPQDPRSAQLKLYALAIALLLGYTGPVFVSVTHWPRLPLARRLAPPVRYWAKYEWDELYGFYDTLERLYQTIRAEKEVNPGEWCRFCPSRDYCLDAEPIPVYNWRDNER